MSGERAVPIHITNNGQRTPLQTIKARRCAFIRTSQGWCVSPPPVERAPDGEVTTTGLREGGMRSPECLQTCSFACAPFFQHAQNCARVAFGLVSLLGPLRVFFLQGAGSRTIVILPPW